MFREEAQRGKTLEELPRDTPADRQLRAKELEAQLDSPEVEARLGAVEARLRTVETGLGAIGALVAGLAQPPAPQPLDAPDRMVTTNEAASIPPSSLRGNT